MFPKPIIWVIKNFNQEFTSYINDAILSILRKNGNDIFLTIVPSTKFWCQDVVLLSKK